MCRLSPLIFSLSFLQIRQKQKQNDIRKMVQLLCSDNKVAATRPHFPSSAFSGPVGPLRGHAIAVPRRDSFLRLELRSRYVVQSRGRCGRGRGGVEGLLARRTRRLRLASACVCVWRGVWHIKETLSRRSSSTSGPSGPAPGTEPYHVSSAAGRWPLASTGRSEASSEVPSRVAVCLSLKHGDEAAVWTWLISPWVWESELESSASSPSGRWSQLQRPGGLNLTSGSKTQMRNISCLAVMSLTCEAAEATARQLFSRQIFNLRMKEKHEGQIKHLKSVIFLNIPNEI